MPILPLFLFGPAIKVMFLRFFPLLLLKGWGMLARAPDKLP
jgi:hypothetical protein